MRIFWMPGRHRLTQQRQHAANNILKILPEHSHMKPTINSRRKSLTNYIAAILLSSASFVCYAQAGNDGVVQTAAGVSYVSGGVGADSIARLDSLAKDFNVKLVFALKSGNYVSDVRVMITDSAGKTRVDAIAQGPWFLIRLPAGSYQVAATFAERSIKQKVDIGSAKLKTMHFRWDTE